MKPADAGGGIAAARSSAAAVQATNDDAAASKLVAPVPVPDRHTSRGTSSRRPIWSRRGPDISPEPSPRFQSTQRERHGERQHRHHHRARDESPRFHSLLRGSGSPPSSSKRRKGSTTTRGRHWSGDEDDDEGAGSRGQHSDELAYPSSRDRGHNYPVHSKKSSSPPDRGERSLSVPHHSSPRGKPQLPLPVEISPWDDGYDSPSSPSYPRKVEEYRQRGLHVDDQDVTPDCLDPAPGFSDGSGIAGRETNFKYEDAVVETERGDSKYDALVDDFMDAMSNTWHNPNIEVDKNARQKQTIRFVELALKRYNKNKNNKVKYALVEAIRSGGIWEDSVIYAHMNFYAKAKNGPKKNDGRVLVFAELHHIGRRPNAMILTCFRLLDENNQLGGRYHQPRNSLVMQDHDTAHCYACSDNMRHPEGSCYKAGHVVCTSYYNYN